MTLDFPTEEPGMVFRIGHAPDPMAWVDWSRASPDRTFGNRWDDSEGNFRTLYASNDRRGCLVETLAIFRPDPAVAHARAYIDDNAVVPDRSVEPGTISRSWFDKLLISCAHARGRCVTVGAEASLALLRRALGNRLAGHGIADLDAATIRVQAPRALTQEIATLIYSTKDSAGAEYCGIMYLSRYGDDIRNWAFFEGRGVTLSNAEHQAIALDDPDLLAVLERHDLQIGS